MGRGASGPDRLSLSPERRVGRRGSLLRRAAPECPLDRAGALGARPARQPRAAPLRDRARIRPRLLRVPGGPGRRRSRRPAARPSRLGRHRPHRAGLPAGDDSHDPDTSAAVGAAARATVRRARVPRADDRGLSRRRRATGERPARCPSPPPSMPARVAFLQYTSGSTSHPKGVMVTHANILANVRMLQETFALDADTRMVGWLPLFHDMGLIGFVLVPVYLGCTSTILSPAAFLEKPVRWLRAITRYRGTISSSPNFAYDLCSAKIRPEDREGLDLSSWRCALNGSEPVSARTHPPLSRDLRRSGAPAHGRSGRATAWPRRRCSSAPTDADRPIRLLPACDDRKTGTCRPDARVPDRIHGRRQLRPSAARHRHQDRRSGHQGRMRQRPGWRGLVSGRERRGRLLGKSRRPPRKDSARAWPVTRAAPTSAPAISAASTRASSFSWGG